MHKTFGDLIRDLVEVYVDDIVVKVKSSAKRSVTNSLKHEFELHVQMANCQVIKEQHKQLEHHH
jgi:hypothetical protein